MSETFADKVKALNLPLDQIIVIGSGILDQLGIRPASDIDLAASPDLMKNLSEESGDWIKKFDDNQRFYFVKMTVRLKFGMDGSLMGKLLVMMVCLITWWSMMV